MYQLLIRDNCMVSFVREKGTLQTSKRFNKFHLLHFYEFFFFY